MFPCFNQFFKIFSDSNVLYYMRPEKPLEKASFGLQASLFSIEMIPTGNRHSFIETLKITELFFRVIQTSVLVSGCYRLEKEKKPTFYILVLAEIFSIFRLCFELTAIHDRKQFFYRNETLNEPVFFEEDADLLLNIQFFKMLESITRLWALTFLPPKKNQPFITKTESPESCLDFLNFDKIPRELSEDPILSQWTDPISLNPIRYVLRNKKHEAKDGDGILYEKKEILQYINRCIKDKKEPRCPIARSPLSIKDLEEVPIIQAKINSRLLFLSKKLSSLFQKELSESSE